MNRSKFALLSFALILAIRTYQHVTHTAVYGSWALEPVVVLWTAYLVPAMLPVILAERFWLHIRPWDDGNFTMLWMSIVAPVIWFFPYGRIERWFGVFDAFQETAWQRLQRWLHLPWRVPTAWECAATVLDAWRRLKGGNGKMGGWA